jgi:hypothetical protein
MRAAALSLNFTAIGFQSEVMRNGLCKAAAHGV